MASLLSRRESLLTLLVPYITPLVSQGVVETSSAAFFFLDFLSIFIGNLSLLMDPFLVGVPLAVA
jgi:hypothetical protein